VEIVAWRSCSYSGIVDMELMIGVAPQLKAKGIHRDWRSDSYADLVAYENLVPQEGNIAGKLRT